MKQVLYLLLLFVITVSCRREVKPIEKFYNRGYVVVYIENYSELETNLQIKNTDSIKWITVLPFDAKNLKVGDSLK